MRMYLTKTCVAPVADAYIARSATAGEHSSSVPRTFQDSLPPVSSLPLRDPAAELDGNTKKGAHQHQQHVIRQEAEVAEASSCNDHRSTDKVDELSPESARKSLYAPVQLSSETAISHTITVSEEAPHTACDPVNSPPHHGIEVTLQTEQLGGPKQQRSGDATSSNEFLSTQLAAAKESRPTSVAVMREAATDSLPITTPCPHQAHIAAQHALPTLGVHSKEH
jgi:hypothetical protein